MEDTLTTPALRLLTVGESMNGGYTIIACAATGDLSQFVVIGHWQGPEHSTFSRQEYVCWLYNAQTDDYSHGHYSADRRVVLQRFVERVTDHWT